jgi:hypothetical protein
MPHTNGVMATKTTTGKRHTRTKRVAHNNNNNNSNNNRKRIERAIDRIVHPARNNAVHAEVIDALMCMIDENKQEPTHLVFRSMIRHMTQRVELLVNMMDVLDHEMSACLPKEQRQLLDNMCNAYGYYELSVKHYRRGKHGSGRPTSVHNLHIPRPIVEGIAEDLYWEAFDKTV